MSYLQEKKTCGRKPVHRIEAACKSTKKTFDFIDSI
jgi:hypothetical protein